MTLTVHRKRVYSRLHSVNASPDLVCPRSARGDLLIECWGEVAVLRRGRRTNRQGV
jgi:hypothetical protein